MRLILGLDHPSAGSVTSTAARYAQLSAPMHHVGALLDAGAVTAGGPPVTTCSAWPRQQHRPRRVDEVLGLVGLADVAGKRRTGVLARHAAAARHRRALLGDPAILMFDEPVNGLDPEGIRWIRDLMRSLAAEGRTVSSPAT